MDRTGIILCLFAAVWAGLPGTGAALAGPVPPDSAAGSASDYPTFVAPDTVRIEAGQVPGETDRRVLLARPGPPAGSGVTPQLSLPSRLPGLEREPLHLSPFARTMLAADRGANTGLFLGGVGNLLGLWDEDTAMALMGAGAALGAILEGTGAAAP